MSARPRATVEWREWDAAEDDLFRPGDHILTIRCQHGESKTYHSLDVLLDGVITQHGLTRLRLDIIRGQHWCDGLEALAERYARRAVPTAERE